MSKIIGIDLGTSNSAAATLDHGRPSIIPSAEGTSLGGKAFPSVVAGSGQCWPHLPIGCRGSSVITQDAGGLPQIRAHPNKSP